MILTFTRPVMLPVFFLFVCISSAQQVFATGPLTASSSEISSLAQLSSQNTTLPDNKLVHGNKAGSQSEQKKTGKKNKQNTARKSNKKKKEKWYSYRLLYQHDYNRFDGAYNAKYAGATATDDFPRRARVSLGLKNNSWDYAMLLDVLDSFDEDSEKKLVMARLRYKGFGRGFHVDLGKIREEMGLEAMTSSAHLSTIERSAFTQVFSPYFNWGIGINQFVKDYGLRYSLGMYQSEDFSNEGKGHKGDNEYATTARLTWAPWYQSGRVVHMGIWASYREFDETVDRLHMRSREEVKEANNWITDYRAGGTSYLVDSLEQQGVELAGVWHALAIQGEYAERKVDAADAFNNNRYEGGYLMAGLFLTGESRRYTQEAAFAYPRPRHSWGAVELVVRQGWFDASNGLQGTDVETRVIGLNYHYGKYWRLMLNQIHTQVEGPGAITLGEYVEGDALTVRMQFLF